MTARGMIHGRFQPFHNGHLEYLKGAAAQSDELFVGITNPDPTRIRPEAADPLRHRPESNPWSYVERLLMVKAAASLPVRPPSTSWARSASPSSRRTTTS